MIEMLLAAAAHAPAGFGGPAGIWDAIVHDFSNITEPAAFAAFLQVLMIDLVLAGDNAIVVGALAAGLPAEQRRKVILIGVLAALVLRILFALIVTQLLQIIGLILIGGLLLLWVAWRMWRDLRDHPGILIVGLIFAVAMMGIAANVIARYIERYRWIAWVGLAVIVYVAGKMIYDGWVDPTVGLGRLFT